MGKLVENTLLVAQPKVRCAFAHPNSTQICREQPLAVEGAKCRQLHSQENQQEENLRHKNFLTLRRRPVPALPTPRWVVLSGLVPGVAWLHQGRLSGSRGLWNGAAQLERPQQVATLREHEAVAA